MQRLTNVQAATSYGVIDPLALDRRDTKFLQASLYKGDNIMLLPQGPYIDRGGTTDFGRSRRKLETLATEALAVQSAVSSWPHDVSIDLGSALAVTAIDLGEFSLSEGDGTTGTLTVQYDAGGGDWQDFAATPITTFSRRRRLARAPGIAAVTAQNWRIRFSGLSGTRDVTIGSAVFIGETSGFSNAVAHEFSHTDEIEYLLVLTEGNIDIYRDGQWQAAATLPASEATLYEIKAEKRFDTVIFTHQALEPHALQRQGNDDQWQCKPLFFENLPRTDFGDTDYDLPIAGGTASLPGATIISGTPSDIIDGNTATRCIFNPTKHNNGDNNPPSTDTNLTLIIDLGEVKRISRIQIIGISISASYSIGPLTWNAYSEDGIAWKAHGEQYRVPAYGALGDFETQEEVHARYVGIQLSFWTGAQNPLGISEIRILEYTSGIDEMQEVQFPALAANDILEVYLEGEQAQSLTYVNAATLVNDLKASLEALPNVDAGITVESITATKYRIIFTGGTNAARPWLSISILNATKGSAAITTRVRQGKYAGEEIMSAARGWPAVAKFMQERMLLAGFASSPNGLAGSVTGQPFNLDTTLTGATAGFFYEIDAALSETLRIADAIVGGRLMLIGTNGIAYLGNASLSANEIPEFRGSDASGIKRGTTPVQTDARIIYAQRSGSTINVMNYSELEQNFISSNASLLSAGLINEPVSMAHSEPIGDFDADVIFIVMDDGKLVPFTLMRNQEIAGFCRHLFAGKVRSAACGRERKVWLTVEHDNQGTREMRVERMDFNQFLDAAIEQDHDPATTTIAGLDRFNGKEIWVIGDNQPYGPYTVALGQVELPDAVSHSRAGFWQPVDVEDHAIYLEEETRRQMARLKRVYEAGLSLVNTNSVAISVNDGPLTEINLDRLDEVNLDTPLLERAFTGIHDLEGMPGFTRHGRLRVSQLHPGRLCVRSVTKHFIA